MRGEKRKRGSSTERAAASAHRIAIERDETCREGRVPRGCAGVSAAAEGGVDVDAVGLDRQRGHGFVEQDRDMVAIGHQSEKPSSSGGRPPAGNATACAVRSSHLLLVPELELVALADQHDVLVERRVLAQRRRHENATGRVDLDVVGVADEQALQAADACR